MNTFWGINILWIFFGGHPKIGLVLWVISMYLGSFLKVNIQNWDIFLGRKNFKYFLGCFKFLIFFWWLISVNINNPLHGVARTLKKLRISTGDYWIKQWFSSIPSFFSKEELLLKEGICSQRERILSFKSSSLWNGKSLSS